MPIRLHLNERRRLSRVKDRLRPRQVSPAVYFPVKFQCIFRRLFKGILAPQAKFTAQCLRNRGPGYPGIVTGVRRHQRLWRSQRCSSTTSQRARALPWPATNTSTMPVQRHIPVPPCCSMQRCQDRLHHGWRRNHGRHHEHQGQPHCYLFIIRQHLR